MERLISLIYIVMKSVVGLGNPELKYQFTRHNAGFLVLDQLATKYSTSFEQKKSLHTQVAKIACNDEQVLLAKPVTYMNMSGKAVISLLNWYKIATEQLLVVHDDVSLPLGKIRFQNGGGSGGHHGIESIVEYFGHDQFQRLKIGVGPDPGGKVRADYVLSTIPQSEHELYRLVISATANSAVTWIAEGIAQAMNEYNGHDFRDSFAEQKEKHSNNEPSNPDTDIRI